METEAGAELRSREAVEQTEVEVAESLTLGNYNI